MENKLNKAQQPINDRIKILIKSLGMSARAFSHALEVSESTTRNYLDKGSKPSADYIERIANCFGNVNLAWLITGKGEVFTDEGQNSVTHIKNTQGQVGQVIGTNHGNATQTNNTYTLSECQRERDSLRVQLDKAQSDVQSLRDQLERADRLAATQQEMIDLFRGGFNRPN